MVVAMNGKDLTELCNSLAELCDIPETSPGALYGIKDDLNRDAYKIVPLMYAGVAEDVSSILEEKHYVEKELIEGFDQEQHYQQLALISQKVINSFIPQIAFSETQLTSIKFPICLEGELTENKDVDGNNEVDDEEPGENDDDGDEIWDKKKRSKGADTAFSESEDDEENDIEDEEAAEEDVEDEEEEEDLEGEEDDILGGEEDEEEEEIGEASNEPIEDWDIVEGKEAPADNNKPLSTFEKSRKRLNDEIQKMEGNNLKEKPWQLKGDVGATNRPVNSLLSEVLEYDLTQRPAPVITEEVTLRLEDIILKRIKDKAFDDVERKVKPVNAPLELKKKLVLDQEKSKLSLAEVYEQEYVKQKSKAKADFDGAMPTSVVAGEELTKEEKEVNNKLKILFSQLDCLSNFHYTPPPRIAEIEIVSNIPAVSVEEVGQDALTDATLLTAGEVAGKLKRTIKGSSEKSSTDKKRERRKKKIRQAKQFKKAAAIAASKPVVPVKGGKIKIGDPALKSSTKFFTQLAENQAKKFLDNGKRRAEENEKKKFNAKKIKL